MITGLAEVAGFASYAVGARHGIAIAAVLASQFAAWRRWARICSGVSG